MITGLNRSRHRWRPDSGVNPRAWIPARGVTNYPFLAHLATTLNDISSIGSFILGASTFIFP